MASESVTGIFDRVVPSRNPTTTFEQVVFPIKSWCGEIIISRVDFKAVETVDRCLGPLPNVPNQIEQAAWEFVLVDRAWRHRAFEIDVPRRGIPVWLVGGQWLAHLMPFGFGWHANMGASCLLYTSPSPRDS